MKQVMIFGLGIIAGGLLLGGMNCLRTHRPETIIREPTVPSESRLEYQPPPPPSLSLDLLFSASGPGRSAPGSEKQLTFLAPGLEKITEDIYVGKDWGIAQVGMIVTSEGVVIVDTAESPGSAEKILARFRRLTQASVKYIIYTHFHQDHTQGSKVFYEPGVEVIATEAFLYWLDYQNNFLGPWHRRARSLQAGIIEPDYAFDLPVKNPMGRLLETPPEIVMPTITFASDYSFTLGGKRFELFATKGETEDHLAVWLPEERVLFVGDLYYPSFPNLSSPMLEARPVRGWIQSLERFRELKPEHLVLGHGAALHGEALIADHLTNYRDAIKWVHDETVRCINEGKSVEEAVAEVKLPEDLAGLPYLQELYGRVSWAVRGIYHGYTGWYDGKGAGLNPLPPHFRARELVNLAGADHLLARAIELQKKGEHQLAIELCDVVITANPQDRLAHRIKAESLHHLAFSRANLNCLGFYRSAYALEMKAAGMLPGQ